MGHRHDWEYYSGLTRCRCGRVIWVVLLQAQEEIRGLKEELEKLSLQRTKGEENETGN